MSYCERSQLRLLDEPALNPSNVRVELGRPCEPWSYKADGSLGAWHAPRRPSPCCGGFLGERRCGCRRGARASGLQAAHLSGTTIDATAKFLVVCAKLGHEPDRMERAILIQVGAALQPRQFGIRQRALIGRQRSMIALDYFRAFSYLAESEVIRLRQIVIHSEGW